MEIDEESFIKVFLKALDSELVIDKLKHTQSELRNEVSNLRLTIENQNKIIDKLVRDQDISKCEISELKSRIEDLEQLADDQEQYSRRNSVRIVGIPENHGERIYDVVLDFLNNKLVLERPITTSDIDRIHRVGSPASSRPILVKFATYQVRQLLFRARKKLRDGDQELNNIYINEDLTQTRSQLLYEARKMKKNRHITDAWSYDGKIMIKTKQGNVRSVRI